MTLWEEKILGKKILKGKKIQLNSSYSEKKETIQKEDTLFSLSYGFWINSFWLREYKKETFFFLKKESFFGSLLGFSLKNSKK